MRVVALRHEHGFTHLLAAVLLIAVATAADPAPITVSSSSELNHSLMPVPLNISLRLVGTIALLSTVHIREGQNVSLWSDDGATLDAQHAFRVVDVSDGGRLFAENVSFANGSTEDSGGCIRVQGAASRLTIRSSTLSRCHATDTGGALAVSSGSVALRQVLIEDSRVEGGTGTLQQGGGMLMEDGDLTLEEVTFANTSVGTNSSESEAFGGGLAMLGGNASLTAVVFHGTSALSRNVARAGGAHVRGGNLMMTSVAFLLTSAWSTTGQASAGGLRVHGHATVTLRGALFDGCTARSGGGNAFGGGVVALSGSLSISGSTFRDTQAEAYVRAYGGGVFLHGSSTTVMMRDTTMESCLTHGTNHSEGGAVALQASSSLSIYNVTINNSSAATGLRSVIFVQTQARLITAMLTIRQACTPGTFIIEGGLDGVNEVLLRGYTVDDQGTDCGPHGRTIRCLQCKPEPFPDWPELASPGSVCGLGAACIPIRQYPVCRCKDGALPSPNVPPELAPYMFGKQHGCVTLPQATLVDDEENITDSTARVLLETLTKNTTAAPFVDRQLELSVSGSVGRLPDATQSYRWYANVTKNPQHLNLVLPQMSGNVSAPLYITDSQKLSIPIRISSANMSESSARFRAEVSVYIELPDTVYGHQSYNTFTILFPVHADISAQPVAANFQFHRCSDAMTLSTCHYDAWRRHVDFYVTMGVRTSFEFNATDIDGLPVLGQLTGLLTGHAIRCHKLDEHDDCVNGTALGGNETAETSIVWFEEMGRSIHQCSVRVNDLMASELEIIVVTLYLESEALPFKIIARPQCERNYYSRERRDAEGRWECVPCPRGARCMNATEESRRLLPSPTLETLDLRDNHFRLSPWTDDIRSCAPEWMPNQSTPCSGGANASNYCKEDLTGTLCQVCKMSSQFFDPTSATCKTCPVEGALMLWMPFIVVSSLMLLIHLVQLFLRDHSVTLRHKYLMLFHRIEMNKADGSKHWTKAFTKFLSTRMHGFRPTGILKIMVCGSPLMPQALQAMPLSMQAHHETIHALTSCQLSYYQILYAIPSMFDVELPYQYFAYMSPINFVINYDWVELTIPLSCIGDFQKRLITKALLPLLLVVMIIVLSSFVAAWRQSPSFSTLLRDWKTQGLCTSLQQTAKVALTTSVVHTLPISIFVFYMSVPIVSTRIFSAFSCEEFGYNSMTNELRKFLVADRAVECSGDAYDTLHGIATLFGVLWAFAVPCMFALFLYPSMLHFSFQCLRTLIFHTENLPYFFSTLETNGEGEGDIFEQAIQFLYVEYKPNFRFWELVELVRKLTLTGYLLLIPHRFATLRLVLALLVTIGYLVILTAASPYKYRSSVFFALATNMTLACAYIIAMLIKVKASVDEDPANLAERKEDTHVCLESGVCMAHVIVSFNFAILGSSLLLILANFLLTKPRKIFLLESTGKAPKLKLGRHKYWHLFLSHNWANQDVVFTIKLKLQELLPGIRIFRDVDDLEDVSHLETYIAHSQTMLILLGSPDYFRSASCLREVAAAKSENIRLIRVHDADVTKGGCQMNHLKKYYESTKKAKNSIHSPADFLPFIFPEPNSMIIRWHRAVDHLQLKALALIAEQVEHEELASTFKRASQATLSQCHTPSLASLYLEGEWPWAHPIFPAKVKVYVSKSNTSRVAVGNSLEVSAESIFTMLKERFGDKVEAAEEATKGVYFLLLLTTDCWYGHNELGSDASELAADIVMALKRNANLVAVYVPQKHSFDSIIKETPRPKHSSNSPFHMIRKTIFSQLALEWHEGPYQQTSVNLLAKELGAQLHTPRWYSGFKLPKALSLSRGGLVLERDEDKTNQARQSIVHSMRMPMMTRVSVADASEANGASGIQLKTESH